MLSSRAPPLSSSLVVFVWPTKEPRLSSPPKIPFSLIPSPLSLVSSHTRALRSLEPGRRRRPPHRGRCSLVHPAPSCSCPGSWVASSSPGRPPRRWLAARPCRPRPRRLQARTRYPQGAGPGSAAPSSRTEVRVRFVPKSTLICGFSG